MCCHWFLIDDVITTWLALLLVIYKKFFIHYIYFFFLGGDLWFIHKTWAYLCQSSTASIHRSYRTCLLNWENDKSLAINHFEHFESDKNQESRQSSCDEPMPAWCTPSHMLYPSECQTQSDDVSSNKMSSIQLSVRDRTAEEVREVLGGQQADRSLTSCYTPQNHQSLIHQPDSSKIAEQKRIRYCQRRAVL